MRVWQGKLVMSRRKQTRPLRHGEEEEGAAGEPQLLNNANPVVGRSDTPGLPASQLFNPSVQAE